MSWKTNSTETKLFRKYSYIYILKILNLQSSLKVAKKKHKYTRRITLTQLFRRIVLFRKQGSEIEYHIYYNIT